VLQPLIQKTLSCNSQSATQCNDCMCYARQYRTSHFALRTSHFALRTSHFATPTSHSTVSHSTIAQLVDKGRALVMDRPKRATKQPAKFTTTISAITNFATPTSSRSRSCTENDRELSTDSLPENSNLSDHSQQLPSPTQSASPLSKNEFLELF